MYIEASFISFFADVKNFDFEVVELYYTKYDRDACKEGIFGMKIIISHVEANTYFTEW